MLFFTQSGRVFQLRVHEIPDRERQAKGIPINNLIDIAQGERISSVFVRPEEEDGSRYMLMVTSQGQIKKTAMKEYANVRRNGLIAINLQSGDELNWVAPTSGEDDVIIATQEGKAIRFTETEVRAMGRDTQGVIGIRLGKGDQVAGMAAVRDDEGDLLVVTTRGYGKRTPVSDYPRHHRAGQGVYTLRVTDKVGQLAALRLTTDPEEEVLIITASGMVLRTMVQDIRQISRQTQGVIVMRLQPDDQVVAIAPVGLDDEE
jgi:DNA gyrase subunit A